jgi:hypothetical protein
VDQQWFHPGEAFSGRVLTVHAPGVIAAETLVGLDHRDAPAAITRKYGERDQRRL